MGKTEIIISIVLFNIVLFLMILGIIMFIKQYKLQKKKHKETLEKIELIHKRELIKTQAEIQKETMQQIGREIHDNVGQNLTLSSIYIHQLGIDKDPAVVFEKLHEINAIINESLADLRILSSSLINDQIIHKSIIELLENEQKKVEKVSAVKVNIIKELKTNEVSNSIKIVLLRVTQEFIQNSLKHSNCSLIEIQISNNTSTIFLTLKDNGTGFNVLKPAHFGNGLKNMKTRIEILKGSFQLESDSKNGTSLKIEIPI